MFWQNKNEMCGGYKEKLEFRCLGAMEIVRDTQNGFNMTLSATLGATLSATLSVTLKFSYIDTCSFFFAHFRPLNDCFLLLLLLKGELGSSCIISKNV